MSIKIKKGSKYVEAQLVTELNRLRDLSVGSAIHASATSSDGGDPSTGSVTVLQITAAAPTTELTRVALANDIKRVLNAHFADTYAHATAVSSAIATADATDEATAITLANACKAAYNTGGHINGSNIHANNDGTNTIAAANATNTGSLDTLLAELKTDINAHISSALAGQHIELIDA